MCCPFESRAHCAFDNQLCCPFPTFPNMPKRFLNVEYAGTRTRINVTDFERLGQVQDAIKAKCGEDVLALLPAFNCTISKGSTFKTWKMFLKTTFKKKDPVLSFAHRHHPQDNWPCSHPVKFSSTTTYPTPLNRMDGLCLQTTFPQQI
ncbi:hypothetical protein EDD86DRAFT_90293 [Gorgonomyces haynaldii]|nr:hypothetical protein EDD86DRAFT_90293 [Gorgonomyces haynaldii]